MTVAEMVLFAVAGWCAIGVIGVLISLRRGRREEAIRHAGWLAAVAGVYILVLLGASITQPQRVVAIGTAQCFDEMCFTVTGADEVPGLVAGETDRVVRVRLVVANHGRSAEAEGLIAAYLVDARGREWQPLAGLSGNRLTTKIAGGAEMVSEPMFRVAQDAAGLGLVLTHGNWQPGRLVIGDSDSLGHRKTIVALGR